MSERYGTAFSFIKNIEKLEWDSLPVELKTEWLVADVLQDEERTLWQKYAPKVFEDIVHYTHSVYDDHVSSDFFRRLLEVLNNSERKRQLVYSYDYKENLLSQAKEAGINPDLTEYEYACENIGYELGFLFGCVNSNNMHSGIPSRTANKTGLT